MLLTSSLATKLSSLDLPVFIGSLLLIATSYALFNLLSICVLSSDLLVLRPKNTSSEAPLDFSLALTILLPRTSVSDLGTNPGTSLITSVALLTPFNAFLAPFAVPFNTFETLPPKSIGFSISATKPVAPSILSSSGEISAPLRLAILRQLSALDVPQPVSSDSFNECFTTSFIRSLVAPLPSAILLNCSTPAYTPFVIALSYLSTPFKKSTTGSANTSLAKPVT